MFEKADEIMATYFQATEEFGRTANEFLRQVILLPQAWHSYQQATEASAKLREILDSRDETLRKLMTQLEQAISAPFGKPILTEKKTDAPKATAAGAGVATMGGIRTLP
jgi:exonuclease VII small subunit